MSTLDRRRFLRGLGTLVALPLLDASLPRARAESVVTRRFVHFFTPNGANMGAWTPSSAGSNFDLPASLLPLAPIRDDVLVISGADNVPGRNTHSYRVRCLFAERIGSERLGRTLDQALVPYLAHGSTYTSMQLASEGAAACGTEQCGHLYTVSWADERTAMPRDVHPRAVFEQLFAGAEPGEAAAARARRLQRSRSVLDAVLDDAHTLKAELGPADQQRLDAYLTGVRALEVRLQADPPAEGTCSDALPPSSTTDTDTQVEQMLDLIALALTCDRTRVISYMIGSGESYRSLAFLGQPSTHHSASHNLPDAHAAMTTWQVSKYAGLVARLRDVQQPNGRTLLDDTFVVYASGMSDGDQHAHDNLPLLIAGRGGGSPELGRHVVLPYGTPHANLALAILQALGGTETSFGLDGTQAALDLR